jgi:hypothetical protein
LHALPKSEQAFPCARCEQSFALSVRGFGKWLASAVRRPSERSRPRQKQFAGASHERAPEPVSRTNSAVFEGLDSRKIEFFRGLRLQCARGSKGGLQLERHR